MALNIRIVKYLLVLFIGLQASIPSFSQHQQSIIRLSGTILSAESSEPLTGVHIIRQGHSGTTTDIDGNFSMDVMVDDTIHISHVGFNEFLVPIPTSSTSELSITIALTPSLTELDEIVVYQWPATLSQLKQRILSTEVEEEEKVIIPGSAQGPPRPVDPGLGSPISFLQSKFSRRIRKRQEFLRKRPELQRRQKALSRYNPEYVQEITGIEDQKELEEFMEFCELTDDLIANINDYDFIVAINKCYKDFTAGRPE